MSPPVASLITIVFIIFLWRNDLGERQSGVSNGIWVPFIWFLIAGSRFVSHWFEYVSPSLVADASHIEGNPLNSMIFLGLILMGIWILYNRNLDWDLLLSKNIWLILAFLFCFLSITWSDYPYVALKRLVKTLGNLVMALIILTEKRPDVALGFILRRAAIILIPLSVLFIKYYPEIGRQYHMGHPMFTGVAIHKNTLGQTCLITSIYLLWSLIVDKRKNLTSAYGSQLILFMTLLPISFWLLLKSDSATSKLCLFVGLSILLAGRIFSASQNLRGLSLSIFTSGIVLIVFEYVFKISNFIIVNVLNRETDLTNRLPLWSYLLDMVKSPIIGVGFDSFWIDERMHDILIHFSVMQAHNGYLELYLNLGALGLFIILIAVFSGLFKAAGDIDISYSFSVLKITFISITLLYNWAEATFYGVNNIWLLLLLSIIDMPSNKKSDEEADIVPGQIPT